MYFPEELGIMGTEFWKNCYLAPIWELPEYDSLKKTQLIPTLGAVKWNSQSWSANWALPKQDGEHLGIIWASSSGTITTMDVCGCKTAPSLSEPVRPGCGLIFCPFKLSHILSTAYSQQTPTTMDQAPTLGVFSHSLSIIFSLAPSCFSVLNHHQSRCRLLQMLAQLLVHWYKSTERAMGWCGFVSDEVIS